MGLADDLRKSLKDVAACEAHPPVARSLTPAHAALWWETCQSCGARQRKEHLRWLGRNDLFFLLIYLLNRKHFLRDERTTRWTFDRCNEVQDAPNGYADLWPRESFKSEIITFGKTIQDLINDPELTFGFFSNSRPLAASFLMMIRREFEGNDLLKEVYDDVLWGDPKIDCRAYSVPWTDHAITIKRKGNPKEATIEAWGLTDGQPTSRRFSDIVYDDVVSRDETSEQMMQKTTQELENSFLLTASDPPRYRYVATFQEIGDTTQQVIDRGIFQLRKRGPMDVDGNVAYCSDEKFTDLRRKLSTKVFALQILLDPSQSKGEGGLGFQDDWIEYYDDPPSRRMLNVYGVVDPAGDSIESNSEFALWIIGLGTDKRRRILDICLDKFDLEERWDAIFTRQQKWECLKWGYEKYGFQSDVEHFKYRQKQLNYMFNIVPLGGIRRSKDSRISELIPSFKDHLFIFPRKFVYKRKDGREVDLVKYFREREYGLWPYNRKQRDMLDALARIEDRELGIVFPRGYGRPWRETEAGGGYSDGGTAGGSWLSE